METSYVDVPILESVTYIAKWNNSPQEVFLYYEKTFHKNVIISLNFISIVN